MKKSELKKLIRSLVKENLTEVEKVNQNRNCVSCTTHEDCGQMEICLKEAGSDANTLGCCEMKDSMGQKIKTVKFATKQG